MTRILRDLSLKVGGLIEFGSPWDGFPASELATGFPLPNFLLNDVDYGFPNRLYSVYFKTRPIAGVFSAARDGTASFTGAPDGTYPGTMHVDKLDPGIGLVFSGDGAYSLTVGGATATVSSVTVSPTTATGSTTFSATVAGTNSPSQVVTWTMTGAGSINASTGAYTAPAATSSIQTATITATSTQDGTKSGTATVSIAAAVPGSTVSGVTVSPTTATGSTNFTATVAGTNSPSQAVTWTRSGTAGSINATTGAFTAPAASGSIQVITITATSNQDNTKSGTATVTIAAAVVSSTVSGVTVSPSSGAIAAGATRQFSATVAGTNSPSQAVTWSTNLGTINASTGLLTAPAETSSLQTGTVTATSTQDSSKSGTASFTVAAAIVIAPPAATVTGVALSPAGGSVVGGATRQFSATVAGANSPSQAVTWSADIGQIDSNGLFTAPATTFLTRPATITATSVADPRKSVSTVITIPASTDPVTIAANNLLRVDADGNVLNTGPDTYVVRGRQFWIDKDPNAVMFYGIDLASYLARAGGGITLVGGIVVLAGVEATSDVFVQGDTVLVQLAGGIGALSSLDAVNSCTFHFTMSNGDQDDRTIYFNIVDC